ncbi:MAG: hypothetical protein AAGC63_05830 [Propionicimonas sp.]|nr:hypothetical protein [Propionicimonas sp.]
MQIPPIPPIDLSRWTLRVLRRLDETRRTLFPDPKQAPRPTEPDRSRPDLW